MDLDQQHALRRGITRRQALFAGAVGFGGLALCGLYFGTRRRVERPPGGRVKSVIFLFMDGGPSQVDTFDPKPRLAKDDGKPYLPPGKDTPGGLLMKSPYQFSRHGECGHPVSEIFPCIAEQIDELAIIRSMVTDFNNHATASYLLNTGSPKQGYPSMGAWINYGLGSECDDLPGFVVLESGQLPEGGLATFDSGFLPAKYRATLLGQGKQAIENVQPLEPTPELQRAKLEFLTETYRRQQPELPVDSAVDTLLDNYELAFRMQAAVPDLLETDDESAATLALYGVNEPTTAAFGRQCLLARRLVERGVRFIQLLPPKRAGVRHWDQHALLEHDHRHNAAAVDRPIAGLLQDLRQRGLLQETLVLWGGEFGRTPNAESHPPMAPGRNHNPHGFTMWLAGGKVRPGIVYGATDEYGGQAVENPVHIHDLQATILHLLGIDHTQLTFEFGGRHFRLTDVYGNVVHDLLSEPT